MYHQCIDYATNAPGKICPDLPQPLSDDTTDQLSFQEQRVDNPQLERVGLKWSFSATLMILSNKIS